MTKNKKWKQKQKLNRADDVDDADKDLCSSGKTYLKDFFWNVTQEAARSEMNQNHEWIF